MSALNNLGAFELFVCVFMDWALPSASKDVKCLPQLNCVEQGLITAGDSGL